jgi:hypothetical protein
MPDKPTSPTPQARVSAEQVAAAGQVAANVAKNRSLAQYRPEDFTVNSPIVEVVKGNQYDSEAWLHSPAQLELLSVAYGRLLQVAGKRDAKTNEVTGVRVALLKGTKRVIIWPAAKDDPEAIQVVRYESSVRINLITILAPAKLRVRTGFRERYAVQFAVDCPFGEALEIDLSLRLERRRESTKQESGETTQSSTSTKGKSKAKTGKQKSQPAAPNAATVTATNSAPIDKPETAPSTQIESYDPTSATVK